MCKLTKNLPIQGGCWIFRIQRGGFDLVTSCDTCLLFWLSRHPRTKGRFTGRYCDTCLCFGYNRHPRTEGRFTGGCRVQPALLFRLH